MQRYFGQLSDIQDLKSTFSLSDSDLAGIEIIYAEYEYAHYEGHAQVIFAQDGKLFEVNASHCSCDGFNSGWNPVETSFKALLNLKTTNAIAKQNLQQWAEYHEYKIPEEPKKSCGVCGYNENESVLEFSGKGKNKILLCKNCLFLNKQKLMSNKN